jgi:hypothetical protein
MCDANIGPVMAAEVVSSLVPLIKPGGVLVLTLKLPRRLGVGGFLRLSRACGEVLANAGFHNCETKWLFANSANERTLVASLR